MIKSEQQKVNSSRTEQDEIQQRWWEEHDKMRNKSKRTREVRWNTVLLCFASDSRWDYGQMTTAAELASCKTWTSMIWFVSKGEDSFWGASTSLHCAVSSSQASLTLPAFLIPGAVCGQRAWRMELSGPCLRRQALSPSLAHPQFPWLPPSPPPPPPTLPSSAGQHGSTSRCFDKCFIMSQGTPWPAKNAN